MACVHGRQKVEEVTATPVYKRVDRPFADQARGIEQTPASARETNMSL